MCREVQYGDGTGVVRRQVWCGEVCGGGGDCRRILNMHNRVLGDSPSIVVIAGGLQTRLALCMIGGWQTRLVVVGVVVVVVVVVVVAGSSSAGFTNTTPTGVHTGHLSVSCGSSSSSCCSGLYACACVRACVRA